MLLVVVTAALQACAVARGSPPRTALELHYRQARDGAGRAGVATRAYRTIVARTLATHCRMWPSDSRHLDQNAPRCGPTRSIAMAVARLIVERAAAPRFLPALLHQGKLVWLDPPVRPGCP
jgi:hypothetical protein